MIVESHAPLRRLVQDDIENRMNRTGEVSEAHGESHVTSVATLAGFVGELYGYTEREKELAATCGLLHDLIRMPTEDPSVRDEAASAMRATEALESMTELGVYVTTPEERDAVSYAIAHHGSAPQWMTDPAKREYVPESLHDKLHFALFVGDKIEANGVRVIARRSSFVAGDRLRSPKGDWKQFGFTPDKDEGRVVALESLLRLSFINPEELYPKRLQPLVAPLYTDQRQFVAGLMAGLNLSLRDVAVLLTDRRDAAGRSILEARKIRAPGDADLLVGIFEEKSGVSDDMIRRAPDDSAHSAVETVTYFSTRYTDNLDRLIQSWKPLGKLAQTWKQSMIEYGNGTWLTAQMRKAETI